LILYNKFEYLFFVETVSYYFIHVYSGLKISVHRISTNTTKYLAASTANDTTWNKGTIGGAYKTSQFQGNYALQSIKREYEFDVHKVEEICKKL
jgi:hypothetical protein